jgi:hypothetical protein
MELLGPNKKKRPRLLEISRKHGSKLTRIISSSRFQCNKDIKRTKNKRNKHMNRTSCANLVAKLKNNVILLSVALFLNVMLLSTEIHTSTTCTKLKKSLRKSH